MSDGMGHGLEVIKKTLDQWLDDVDYSWLNNGGYVPSEFSLIFMNFIKLVNGAEGESNKTPPVHLKMLDKLATSTSTDVVNLCFRGSGKTTLFIEYLAPFLAIFGHLPGFGDLDSMIYVSDSMDNGVKSMRKNLEFRYDNSDFLKEWLPEAHFTDNYIEFTSKEGKKFGIRMFGAKTGIRGTKIFGKRPKFAVLDDLISDDDAKSKASMQAINDTVYKGIDYALDPTRRKIVFNGTPFNNEDIMIMAVESGAWDVNVWPVCERFPCTREEFIGAWEDRFGYDYVKRQYDKSVLSGKLEAFNQELMLRISANEDRLVQDSEIHWYQRSRLLQYRSNFNFYITTDFATSDKQTNDFSVISVWAYNSQGDWFWVDGICERQTSDKTVNDLFRLVQLYNPQNVGIEINGQQRAFVKWLQSEMMTRNIWFGLASSQKSGEPGIIADMNKLRRFNLVVPLFKAGKMFFPDEMKTSNVLGHFMSQIRTATKNGLKGKDDCIDTISMLMYLNAWKPSGDTPGVMADSPEAQIGHNGGPNIFEDMPAEEPVSPLSSYIV